MKAYSTTFYRQSEKDIWYEVNDWSDVTFICVMKDNSIQKFIGFLDETYDGQINPHCDCVTSDGYSTDDIKYWGYIPKEIFD